jgi:hypothetical protein
MTASEKELVLKDWEKFLKNGFAWERFTDRLYKHLINNCSFIAHYDRAGFYGTYFQSGDDKVHFLRQFDMRRAGPNGIPPSIEYGMTYWVDHDYGDINRAMIQVAGKYISGLETLAKQEQREADIALADKLLKKHGIERG